MSTPSEATVAFAATDLPATVGQMQQPAEAAVLRTVGNYDLEAEIARGGMGVVFRARQKGLNRVVALKMILTGDHAGPTEQARFRAEAEAVAQLAHAHIVRVIEIGEHEGQLYQALEFCPGGTLASKLAGTPLPARAAAALIEKLARAMQAAHTRAILHRDLKPSNVLFDDQGEPRVADFGLAKLTDRDDGGTRTGTILGTPSYMAPEQARGETAILGPAVDIYALGAILYECLTGRPPFKGVTIGETLEQVRSREPVAVRSLNPAVPRDLETIAHKCLQKEASKRYASAADLAEDLGRFSAGQPVRARPVGPLERGWRWCRRNPLVASLAGLVLLMLVGVAVGATLAALWLDAARNNEAAAGRKEKNARQEVTDQLERQTRANNRLDNAQGLIAQWRWPEALAAHDEAIEAMPKLAAVRLARGRLYFRLGLYPEALADMTAARELQPSLDPRIWDLEALLCRLTDDEAGYDRVVAAALEQFPPPRSAEVGKWLFLLQSLRLGEKPRPELHALVWTTELGRNDANPDPFELFVLGRHADIRPQEIPKIFPRDVRPGRWALEALLRREREQPAESRLASEYVGKALSAQLAEMLSQRADPAVSSRRMPRDFDTRTSMGWDNSLRLGLVELLYCTEIARMLGQDPGPARRFQIVLRATGLQFLGRHAAALPLIEQACAASAPEELLLRVERCRILAHLPDRTATETALRELLQFLPVARPGVRRTHPNEMVICNEVSRIYEEMGNYEAAAEALTHDVTIYPGITAGGPIGGPRITPRGLAVFRQRAQLLARAEKWDQAAGEYLSYFTLGASGDGYLSTEVRDCLQKIARSEPLFQRLRNSFQTNWGTTGQQGLLLRAVYLLEQNDRPGARALVKEVLDKRDLERAPLEPEDWLTRELTSAETLLPLALEIAPRDGMLWIQMARIRARQNDREGAAEALVRGLTAVSKASFSNAATVLRIRQQVGSLLAQETLFQRAVQQRPGDPAVWLARLTYQVGTRDGPGITTTLTQARQALPGNVEFVASAGPLLANARLYREAESCLETWSRLRPHEPECWVLRADLSHAQGKIADAAREMGRALDLADQRGDRRAAWIARFNLVARGPTWQGVVRLVTEARPQDSEIVELQGQAAMQANRPQDAGPLFLEAAKRRPTTDLYARAGEALLAASATQPPKPGPPGANLEPAARAFAEALRLRPDLAYRVNGGMTLRNRIAENELLFAAVSRLISCADPWLWLERCWVLLRQQRFAEAEAALDRLLYAAPGNPLVLCSRSQFFLVRGNLDRSVLEAHEALTQLPSLPANVSLRRSTYAWFAGNDRLYQRLSTLRPDDAHLRAARALVKNDRALLAEELTKAPDDSYLRYLRAHLLAGLGQWAEAEADFVFLAARSGFERDPVAAEEIALGLARTGRIEEYKTFRTRLLERFGATTESATALPIARACVLYPLTPEDQKTVLHIASAIGTIYRLDQSSSLELIDLRCGRTVAPTRLSMVSGLGNSMDAMARLLRAEILAGTDQAAEAKRQALASLQAFRANLKKPMGGLGLPTTWQAIALVEILARGVEP